jgi:hypothetical protein
MWPNSLKETVYTEKGALGDQWLSPPLHLHLHDSRSGQPHLSSGFLLVPSCPAAKYFQHRSQKVDHSSQGSQTVSVSFVAIFCKLSVHQRHLESLVKYSLLAPLIEGFFFFLVVPGVWTQDFVICKAGGLQLEPGLQPLTEFLIQRLRVKA